MSTIGDVEHQVKRSTIHQVLQTSADETGDIGDSLPERVEYRWKVGHKVTDRSSWTPEMSHLCHGVDTYNLHTHEDEIPARQQGREKFCNISCTTVYVVLC